MSTNGNIDQYLFLLELLSKFNADVRILKEYKWKNLSKIIPLFYKMNISMDELITFDKLQKICFDSNFINIFDSCCNVTNRIKQ